MGSDLAKVKELSKFLEREESEKIIRNYLKIASVISSISTKSKLLQKEISLHKESFVNAILKYKQNINLKLILKLCKIAPSVFYSWKKEVQYKCISSPIKKCRKIFPTQLSQKETSIIKALLTNKQFQYWPINSIAHYAKRENILHASIATWYNYANRMGIKRYRVKKKRYNIGIRATKVHEIWHADITIVKCLDGTKYFVYLLMDNFSRFILDYSISEKISANIRLDSIRSAYTKYSNTITSLSRNLRIYNN